MKILLVEDDPFFQKFYFFKLREKQFEVEIAKDGVEAMQFVKQAIPDVILLDLIMPNKDGFEVLQELAADPNLKQIPVLVFSTLSQEADVVKAKQLGARDYVNKSFFDFDSLLIKIQSVMTHH
ncbi:MAG: response regulator [Candidatus Levybacteria bacterium]|nr:response regulator [Candidatus Levybacteria bacterium]